MVGIVTGLCSLTVADEEDMAGLGTRSGLSDNPVMSRAVLLDASGRRVRELYPGANYVRALAPGAYFVREAQAQAQAQAVGRVVVTR